jgi:two-component system invasion response regulator UvrY
VRIAATSPKGTNVAMRVPLRRGGGGLDVIKVLVADDHAIVRRGIRQILSETSDITVGGEAGTAEEVRRLVREQRWDVVVLDISLPGGSGMDLLVELRRERPDLRVLILTVYSEEQYAIRAIRAGAAGFLTKESAPDKLLDAVRKVSSGGRYVSTELAETLASVFAGDATGAPHERLSDREFEILKMLASGKTVSEIALDLSLSVKTVSTHRTRLLKKMEMRTNAELTHYAVRNRLVE